MRAVLLAVLITGAVVFDDLVLYQHILVPRLPAWHSVPWYWWLFVRGSELLSLVAAGLLVRSVRELLVCSATAAILAAVYSAWAASSGQPGHLKSLEAPIQLWIVSPVAAMGLCVVAIGSVRWLAARLSDHRRHAV